MRLALIGPYPLDTSSISGGVAAVMLFMVQGLRQQPDIDLHVVSCTKEIEENRVVKDGNVTIHYLAESKQRVVPNLITNLRRIRHAIDRIKPDLIHSESPAGTLMGISGGYPTIHTIHGISHQERKYARTFSRKIAVWLEGYLGKKAASRAKYCITPSNYAARAYGGITKAKIYPIFNPIEDKFFDIDSQRVNPKKMLYAGQFSNLKNIYGLVKSFELINRQDPDARLFICGKVSDPGYYKLVLNYIKTHNLSETVNLLGFISQDEVNSQFAEAAIICLFSHQESAPMAVAQAMCAGKPVVASAVGGTPDIVIDGETGFLVNDGDECAFAEKALMLLSDDELRYRMGQKAREVAEKRFRKDVVVTKTMKVYAEVLGNQ